MRVEGLRKLECFEHVRILENHVVRNAKARNSEHLQGMQPLRRIAEKLRRFMIDSPMINDLRNFLVPQSRARDTGRTSPSRRI